MRTRSNSGRSTTGAANVPRYFVRETARCLRLTLTRYLAGRCSFQDVENAYELFHREMPK